MSNLRDLHSEIGKVVIDLDKCPEATDIKLAFKQEDGTFKDSAGNTLEKRPANIAKGTYAVMPADTDSQEYVDTLNKLARIRTFLMMPRRLENAVKTRNLVFKTLGNKNYKITAAEGEGILDFLAVDGDVEKSIIDANVNGTLNKKATVKQTIF
jgi:hypothetical protein